MYKSKGISFLFFVAFILIIPAISRSQKNIEQVQHKFQQQAPLFQEKLYIHTDKNFYLAGEIMWFKIYTVNGETHLPVNISKLAYVEILDRNSNPVLQEKVSLSANGGEGSFYLPVTLNSDHYILRAYTNWMKNDEAANIFEQQITIVNTIKAPRQEKNIEVRKTTVSFFPEGGYLVDGIETKVGFHIADQSGKGVNANGIIKNENGDTVLHFSSNHFGMGHFIFKPETGRAYQAIIKLPSGESTIHEIPAIMKSGFVMNVVENENGQYKINVFTKGLNPGKQGEQVTILAHTRNSLKFIETGFADYNNGITFYLDKTKLGDGVSHITLFNEQQQPVCERLVFKKPRKNELVTFNTDKKNYQKREKVALSFSLDKLQYPDSLNYSVSVFETDGLGNNKYNIQNYFWLGSFLQGQIESPEFYFSDEIGNEEAADNLMLTHGWRRFNWDKGNSKTMRSDVKYIPEFRGHLITAKVTQLNNQLPATGVECLLTVPAEPIGFYAAKTDSLGIVHFDVKDYYGPGDIIIQVRSETNATYKVELINPYAEIKSKQVLPVFSLSKEHEEEILQRSLAMQVQNIFRADSIRKFTLPPVNDTFPFYGKADFTYLLDSYKRFTTMEEVLREYVLPITVVVRNGQLRIRMSDELSGDLYDDHILLLLDGVPLRNVDRIFAYDPLKIKKLDVLPRQYLVGSSWFNGIASFETFDGRFDGFELDPSIVTVDYEGLQLQREFYSPVYQNENQRSDRVPDHRTTLLWQTGIIKDTEGNTDIQFYTSDQRGRFLIVMEGITAAGEIINASTTITVE